MEWLQIIYSNYATFKEKNGGSQSQLNFTVLQNI